MNFTASLRSVPVLIGFVLPPVALGQSEAPAPSVQDVFSGSWHGEIVLPIDPTPRSVRLGLEQTKDGAWHGGLQADLTGPGLLRGPAGGDSLKLECAIGGEVYELRVSPGDKDKLDVVLVYRGLPIALELKRTSSEWDEDLRFEVQLPEKRPSQRTLEGMHEEWLVPIERRVAKCMDEEGIVGLALGIAVDGELFDVRSWGWSDVKQGLPVTGETLFRWASISKVVTGVVAGKLSLEETLDLDQDVRQLVPEFPEKKHVVTTRQLLGHLGGIVHYQHLPVAVQKDYGVEFPFKDPVRALDVFLAAPLIHAPGSAYSYSTHGFVLAGAVIERSSERGFRGEVRRLVSQPLKMTTFELDDPAAPRSARTVGYRHTADGRVYESGDSNVAWKLAGGGFQSTVSDLARFGGALSDEYFVPEALQDMLFVSQKTEGGKRTGYSLGLRVAKRGGRLLVSHGGAQRRTRTYLVCAPRERLAVAIMCNTEGVNVQDLGNAILRVLLDEN